MVNERKLKRQKISTTTYLWMYTYTVGISRGVPVARLKPTNLRVMLCHPGIHLFLRIPQENISGPRKFF